jgi:hypothetical protein
MNRMMAPFAAPTKAPSLQGKSRRVPGSVSFGGSNRLVCLLLIARSTAATGARASPTAWDGGRSWCPCVPSWSP